MLAQLCDKTTALAGGGVCVHRVKSLMYQTYYITITGKAFQRRFHHMMQIYINVQNPVSQRVVPSRMESILGVIKG